MAYLENLEREKMEKIQKEFEFYCHLQRIVNEAEKYDSSYNLDYLKGLIEMKSRQLGKKIKVVPTIEKQENMQFFKSIEDTAKSFETTISMVVVALGLDFAKKTDGTQRSVVMRHQNDSIGALHILLSHPEDMMELIPGLNVYDFPPNIQEYLRKYKKEKKPGTSKKQLTDKEKKVKEEEQKARVEAAKEWFRQRGNWEYRQRLIANELLLLNYLQIQIKKQIQKHEFRVWRNWTTRFSISFPVTIGNETRTLRICLRCADSEGKAIVWTSAKDEKGKTVNMEAFEIITAYLE